MPKSDDLSALMSTDDDIERTWGLDVDDIEAITAKQLRGDVEYGTCYLCSKKMFRASDYSGRMPEWRHSSTGYPQSYTPQIHDAQDQHPLPEHEHEWLLIEGYLSCQVANCGARKLVTTTAIPRGVFMPSIKDQQLAAARARGLAAGTVAQKKATKPKAERVSKDEAKRGRPID